MTPEVRVTIPLTEISLLMSEGLRSRMTLISSRLKMRACAGAESEKGQWEGAVRGLEQALSYHVYIPVSGCPPTSLPLPHLHLDLLGVGPSQLRSDDRQLSIKNGNCTYVDMKEPVMRNFR